MIRLSIFGLKLFYIRLLTSLMFSELHFGLGIWAVLALILQLNYFYEDFWIHKRLNTSSEKNPSVKALIEQVASFKLQHEIGSFTQYYVKITLTKNNIWHFLTSRSGLQAFSVTFWESELNTRYLTIEHWL